MKTLHEGWLTVMLACALVCGTVSAARAQSCGDPNGDGLDVIDAANVLRQAVDLPSSCADRLAFCDVDGDGVVTVIDAASVLRRVVDLPGANACVLASEQIEQVIQQVQPFLTLGIGFIPGQSARAAQAEECDSGFVDFAGDTVFFQACQFETIVFDGSITATGDSVSFDLTIQDLTTQASITFQGSLTASNDFLNGTMAISSSEFDSFSIAFQDLNLTLSDAEIPISGTILIEVGSASLSGISSIELSLDGTEIAGVLVTLDNQTTQRFFFNLTTGDLTPI